MGRFQECARRFGTQDVATAASRQEICRIGLTGLEFLDRVETGKSWNVDFEIRSERDRIERIRVAHAGSSFRSITASVSHVAVIAGLMECSRSIVTL